MALTRKFLAALGIEQEKIDEIIEAHTATVTALKEERDKYRDAQEEFETTKKELEDLRTAAEKNKANPYKQQYEDLKAEYEKYKSDTTARETRRKKEDAYRALLKEAGVSAKRIEAIMKVSSVDDLELDSEDHVKGSDAVLSKIKTEWADFIQTEQVQGAEQKTPPVQNGGGKEHTPSRAAQIAAKHYETVYGKKGESNP